ncbi:MAG: hypothetical protein ACOCXG_00965 [Nanoarchaeota archaeon]
MNLDKVNHIGKLLTNQLVILFFVFFFLSYFNIFVIDLFLSLELFSLVLSILVYSFFNKKDVIKTLVLLVVFLVFFVLSFFLNYSFVLFLMPLVAIMGLFYKSSFKVRDYRELMKLLFESSLVIYLMLLVLNEFSKVIFVNLNVFLGLVIVLGVISILNEPKSKREDRILKKDYVLGVVLGIVGGVLIFVKTKELGWLSVIISIISVVLIILVSFLILEEEDEEK